MTRRSRLFPATLAIVFLGTPAGASPYGASTPITVSGDSPFADCTADASVPYPYPLIVGSEREPFLAVDPLDPDHIVGSWMQDLRSRGIGVGASFDGGESWETTVIPGTTLCAGGEYQFIFDPWLDFAADGSLFHIGLPGIGSDRRQPDYLVALAVNASRDGGLTWSDPIFLDVGGYPERGVDKPSITADPFDPNYVYATWNYRSAPEPPLGGGAVSPTRFSRSTDGGASWEEPRTTFDLRDDLGFGRDLAHRILVLPDGMLVNLAEHYDQAAWLTKDATILAQRSVDRGVTWTPTDETALVLPKHVVRPIAPDDGNTMLIDLFSAAVDRNTGSLYVVWGDARDEDVTQAHFSMSTDAGRTWSEPIRVGDTPAGNGLRSQSFLPTVAVTGDGTVGVLFYDWRLDDEGPETLTDVWLAHCHARSADCSVRANWHRDARMTESSFNLRELPLPTSSSAYFPGDYLGLTATEHDFLAFFTMPHDGDPGSVFFSRIAPVDCAGNCNDDDHVSVSELVVLVNVALGRTDVSACQAGDLDRNGEIAISELVAAVNAALRGCLSVADDLELAGAAL